MALPNLDELEKKKKDEKKDKGPSLPSLDMPPLDDSLIEDTSSKSNIEEVEVEMPKPQDVVEEPIVEEPNKEVADDFTIEEVDELEEIRTEDDYYPEMEEDIKRNKEKKYIDKKKKKIIPTGGKRSKRRIKASEFDDRKNVMAKTRIIRGFILLVILALFGFGIKNTFFPSHVYTADQIKAFARAGAGQTEFPKERGIAFVESFMETYLTIDSEDPVAESLLSYYYGKSSDGEIITPDELKSTSGYKAKQRVLVKPKVFEVIMATDHSALFKVSSYVTNTDGTASNDNEATGRWVSFAVNVYYDKEIDSLAITRDSPSRIPAYEIKSPTIVPTEAELGNGRVNNDILPELIPTIHGYITAYADASIAHHEGILQYVTDKKDPELYGGFGGAVKLDGEPDKAIEKVAYDSVNSNEYKVDVVVRWEEANAKGGENKVTYDSRYVMTIKDVGDNKYLVSSFKPFVYSAKK